MASDAETSTMMPVVGTLNQFNKYGLPGLVIGVLFCFLGVESFYGIRALINNTRVMTQMDVTLQELRKEINDCREAK